MIGPNQYLLEMLRHSPELAAQAVVLFHEQNDAADDYREIGCAVGIDEAVGQIRAQVSFGNICRVFTRHTAGLMRLMKAVRENQPHLLVSNTEQLMIGGMVARMRGIPHVKVFHALTFAHRLTGRPFVKRVYLVLLSLWCDVIVAVSETMKEALLSGGVPASRVVTIANPLDCTRLRVDAQKPLPADLDALLAHRHPIVLSAGVIFPKKGQDRLIEAMPELRSVHPGICCVLAGGVGERSGLEDTVGYFHSLQKRVKELNLESCVVFVGDTPHLPALMNRSDVYVQTSRTESFCRSVAEALVCGAPVVAYAVGAIPEAAGPGGVMVRDGDTAGLVESILALLADPARGKRLAEEGGRYVSDHFDAPTVSRKFSDMMASL